MLGNVLFSRKLSSALKGLTSVFGMGTGVPPSLSSPSKYKRNNSFKTRIMCTQSKLKLWLNPRLISTGQLNMLPCFHLQPINVVVFHESYFIKNGKTHLEVGFPLRCFQRLSIPYIATLRCNWRYNRYTRGRSIPVLSY